MKLNHLLFIPILLTAIYGCEQKAEPPLEAFKKTWYVGKAELTSYTLQQARYGEIRSGEAVLIFVTEDFSTDKLVKLDEPEKASGKARVLKMNMTKKFSTGVYPYSMMLSVFTPISKEGKQNTLKANCSSQEWCGQTFSQLKFNGNSYNYQLQSYFENEGEQVEKIGATLLEDELWNRIRLNPFTLPQGKASLLPGLFWQRLSHVKLKEEVALLTLSKADTLFIKNSGLQMYTIHYPAAQRTLQIYFQPGFPNEIMGWQETYPDGFRKPKKMLTTKAIRKKTIWLDYWKHNAITDSTYIDSLQLMHYE